MKNKINRIKVVENVPIDTLINPIRKFFKIQASGGILLLIVTLLSLIWANSPFSEYYFNLWNIKISIGFNKTSIDKSILIWINDGLMAIFFFLVGLEIKRELIIGELSSFKKAILPVLAAIGGMIFPAIIYFSLNQGTETAHGWGIPVATDIAFSLGILSLMNKRIPISLKIFLTAFAIIDDIGAVLVIAIFYTKNIVFTNIILAFIIFAILVLFNLLHIRNPILYIIPGILMWIFFLFSGVHPTVSGILLAFTIPTVARIDYKSFLNSSKSSLKNIETLKESEITTSELNSAVFGLEETCENVLAPAHRIEHKLHPYVAYFIIPLFAFANAGVKLEGSFLDALTKPVTLGVILGLFFGNQIGITLFSWLSIKLKISELPSSATFKQIYGIACLGGIGFTMSLFIASLAFDNIIYLNDAKIGIIIGSIFSGIAGYITLSISNFKLRKSPPEILENNNNI